jgi:hypothetical protein
MEKRRAGDRGSFVDHPRFGDRPRLTGLDPRDAADGSVYCHWHSPPGVRVPSTAIAADVSRQRRATIHVTHYFDSVRTCRRCGRPFLFFAEEQRHWYEELQFPLEADCLECAPCRKDLQQLQVARERYETLTAAVSRSDEETLTLVECGLTLVEASVFSTKVLPKLRRLLKPTLASAEGAHFARASALRARLQTLVRADLTTRSAADIPAAWSPRTRRSSGG